MSAIASALAVTWLTMLFTYSGSLKALDLRGSRSAIAAQSLLPAAVLSAAAVLLTAVELAIVVLLVVPYTRPVGAVLAAAVGALACAMVVALSRRKAPVPCGCAGSASNETIGVRTLLRGLLLIAAAWAVALWPSTFAPATLAAFAAVALVPSVALRLRHRHRHPLSPRRVMIARPDLVAQIQAPRPDNPRSIVRPA